ncbi:hypothetical protein CWE09_00805 [Aliidiomarina minuta]|uniref:BON domain-containing protein n=1 Tax=Aliidiomarina minuta TaxID=880057 RepID=A0A432W5G1_9GAMM|nr:BON domain-containing protein [Aliidiomarina minuta]RUO25308.1 hypothetical protein CWE09_00805 [Aliidiomarina minuta]
MKYLNFLRNSSLVVLSIFAFSACGDADTDRAEDTARDTAEFAQDRAEQAGEYIDDSVVTAQVRAAIFSHDDLSNANISVETNDGVVHLSGTVESEDHIELAENEAREVDGVNSVENSLQVGYND